MRLFVGIDLPAAVKDQLGTLSESLPSSRWVNPQQFHVTLCFLGETERTEDIKNTLANIQASPFDLVISGAGRFPTRRRQPPRALWVGIAPEPALHALYQQVTTAMSDIGFVPEDRPFRPHITLARLKTRVPLPEVDTYLSRHQTFALPALPITEFVLFSSQLSPQGSRYHREAVYTLQVR